HCSMEIALLLLLTVSVTAASPIKPTHRSVNRNYLVQFSVDLSDVLTLFALSLSLSPLHHTDRLAVKTRPRRAPQRGCQLGTCQLHILANKLYQIGQTSGKDESTKAQDPRGYGR
uniref:Adrenomedullin n=1 Tax=Myripristis murdjan TaxID=586833 RepID=A0A667WZ59_9TELE